MDIKDGIWWVKQFPVPKVWEMSSLAEGLMSSSGSVRSVAHAAEHEGVRGGVGSVWRRRAGEGFAVISGEDDGGRKKRKKERTAPICTHLTEGHNPLLLETDRESTERKRGRGGKNRRHNDKETERKGKTGVRYRREACTKVVKRKPRPPLLRSH